MTQTVRDVTADMAGAAGRRRLTELETATLTSTDNVKSLIVLVCHSESGQSLTD